jgi:hypothetical protein
MGDLAFDVDDKIISRLEAMAQREGKTLEQLAREILTEAAARQKEEFLRGLDEIRSKTVGKKAVDPVTLIRHDRDTDHSSI